MDLEEEFTKETGYSSIIENYIHSDGYYTQEYVEWLEKKSVDKRELLIDFMKKTQGQLLWGWDLGGGIKVADAYLRGELNIEKE